MTRHIAGIAEIVEDVSLAVRFYRDALGLNVEHEEGAGYALVDVQGTLHFGIWSRASAAEATFGDQNAADRIPLVHLGGNYVPQRRRLARDELLVSRSVGSFV